jgi:cation diffusion facilitator family transporter
MTDQQALKTRVALLSVASNTILVVLKLAIGVMIGSVAVISEAIHSGIDLVAAGVALFAVRTSNKPADRRHPFGHGKIENLSGTFEAWLIFLAALWIIYEAVHKLMKPAPIETAALGVGVMLFSALVNTVVSHQLFKVGRQTDSVALQADAWHLRTDVYTSAGVMAGLAAVWLGGRFYPEYNLEWMDPLCAIAVALLIAKAAYDLTKQSAQDLMDANLPMEEASMRDIIHSYCPVIRGFHYLRTRKAGHQRFVEFHIQVDAEMSVKDSHRLSQELEDKFKQKFPDSTVTIHIEPCTGECPDKCLEGCMLPESERREMFPRK